MSTIAIVDSLDSNSFHIVLIMKIMKIVAEEHISFSYFLFQDHDITYPKLRAIHNGILSSLLTTVGGSIKSADSRIL